MCQGAREACVVVDGNALANARRARGQENVLGGAVEFVVLLVSVVRHGFINLARHARGGVVSSARTRARRSARESDRTGHTLVGRKG